ncbi:MAG: hypothetical protein JKY45_06580 [Emcibacter sp.]|nr:hypothetical protein [Emcibacter sp.]
MPITSLQQFLEFLKFSVLMPFRLGSAFFGVFLVGAVFMIFMYLFAFSVDGVAKIFSVDIVRSYRETILADKMKEFSVLYAYEFIWQLWVAYIFAIVIMVNRAGKSAIRLTNEAVKKNYRAIFALGSLLTIFFILLPMASMRLGYRSEIYYLHHYMIYTISVLFVFSLIEIIQKDKGFFEAAAASVLLLRERYIFTFVVLSLLQLGLNYGENMVFSSYVKYLNTSQVFTFTREVAYVQGALKAMCDVITISIYSGAVIFLYDLYTAQNAKKIS